MTVEYVVHLSLSHVLVTHCVAARVSSFVSLLPEGGDALAVAVLKFTVHAIN